MHTARPAIEQETPSSEKWLFLVSTSCVLAEHLREEWAAYYAIRGHTPVQLLTWSPDVLRRALWQASALLVEWTPDAVPLMSSVCSTASEQGIPAFALCGPREADQFEALCLGADGVLVWPFKPTLLEAHLLAFRRRTRAAWRLATCREGEPAPAARTEHVATLQAGDGQRLEPATGDVRWEVRAPARHDVLRQGVMALDRTARRFFIANEPVELTQLEFGLMDLFLSNPGRCYTRESILSAIWGVNYDTGTNIVDVRIYSLRCKLRAYGLGHVIRTVRGAGYRFDGPDAC